MNDLSPRSFPQRSPGAGVQRIWPLLVLGAVGLILFCWQLDAYSLINVTEARQAEIARQMLVRQDWITPMYNGVPYFDKPVLLHWCIALGFSVFGLHEWVVRMPSALAAIATVLITYQFISVVANRRLAWLTAVMLAANPFTWALGRIGYHDMLLVLLMTTALYAWFWANQIAAQPRLGYLIFFGCLGGAVLAKGPLAIVLCGLILGIYSLWTQQFRRVIRHMPWGWGAMVWSAIALPWYGLVLAANGWDYIRGFLGVSNVSRFVSADQNQWGPWYYYLVWVLVLFFPWMVVIPRYLIGAMRRAWRSQPSPAPRNPTDTWVLFTAIWFGTVFVFMSLAATKLSWYLYPGIPPLAFLCAWVWDRRIRFPDRWGQLEMGVMAVGYGALAIAITNAGLEKGLLNSLETAGLRSVWVWGLACTAGVMVAAAIANRAKWAWWAGVLAFGMIGLSAAHAWMPVLDQQVLDQHIQPIARSLQSLTCETCPEAVVATLDWRFPSLNFYSGLTRIERYSEACDIGDAIATVAADQRLLLVATDDSLADAKLQLPARVVAAESGRFNLLNLSPQDPVIEQFQCPS